MIFRFLVSFHYHQKTDLQTIVDSYAGPYQAFADSGAFSAYSLGATISLKEYAAWLTEWDRLLTVKATLDVIGDPEATMRNTRRLEDMGHRVLPVFHVGTPWDRLEKLCADYDYIALGGMVPFKGNGDGLMRWLVKCFQVAKTTGTVFHGFGQTSIAPVLALPFYSIDSSSWGEGARYGKISLWDDKAQRILRPLVGKGQETAVHAALLRSHGADPALVGAPGFARKAHRTPAQYAKENAMLRGVPAVAYTRLGEHLARRHRVTSPASLASYRDGTHVYLADPVGSHLTADGREMGTHVFLADGGEHHLRAGARGASHVNAMEAS